MTEVVKAETIPAEEESKPLDLDTIIREVEISPPSLTRNRHKLTERAAMVLAFCKKLE